MQKKEELTGVEDPLEVDPVWKVSLPTQRLDQIPVQEVMVPFD